MVRPQMLLNAQDCGVVRGIDRVGVDRIDRSIIGVVRIGRSIIGVVIGINLPICVRIVLQPLLRVVCSVLLLLHLLWTIVVVRVLTLIGLGLSISPDLGIGTGISMRGAMLLWTGRAALVVPVGIDITLYRVVNVVIVVINPPCTTASILTRGSISGIVLTDRRQRLVL